MQCILCGSTDVKLLFHLENGPKYAQKLLETPDHVAGAKVDVELYKCTKCAMVQVDPDSLSHDEYFEDYLMSRSCTELYTEYDNELARVFFDKFSLAGKAVVEIGCGDGYFAERLIGLGADVEAVEPSETACGLAGERGVKCHNIFLDDESSKKISRRYDAFATKQVMDLVKTPNNFLKNLGSLLNKGAVGLIDVPSWSKTLFDRRYYDILPDRVGYYTADTLVKIMERNHFHVIEVFHGAGDEYVGAYVYYQGGPDGLELDFKDEFVDFNNKFTALMDRLGSENKKVAAWGAGAKGVTIFSFTGMSPETISYVVDKDEHKWNHYLPGSLLKVVEPEMLTREPVDAIIVTAAMFYKEIIRELVNQYEYQGEVIILSPVPHVIDSAEIKRILAG